MSKIKDWLGRDDIAIVLFCPFCSREITEFNSRFTSTCMVSVYPVKLDEKGEPINKPVLVRKAIRCWQCMEKGK